VGEDKEEDEVEDEEESEEEEEEEDNDRGGNMTIQEFLEDSKTVDENYRVVSDVNTALGKIDLLVRLVV
jgi:TATA-binding protein-associated factor Taf7